jgi:hypothetical protein
VIIYSKDAFMTMMNKQILMYKAPELDRPTLALAAPGQEDRIVHGRVFALSLMHSAEVSVEDPFCMAAGQITRATMYHQASRRRSQANEFGTCLLRHPDTSILLGRRRTTAYGVVWLDFGVRRVAFYESIDTKADLSNSDEQDAFVEHFARLFPGSLPRFIVGEGGTIDLCVFPTGPVAERNLAEARMFWG